MRRAARMENGRIDVEEDARMAFADNLEPRRKSWLIGAEA
jgi:hypothetical protein